LPDLRGIDTEMLGEERIPYSSDRIGDLLRIRLDCDVTFSIEAL
jgi:hypothetical protein